jgi:hypothetical protein
MDPLTIAALVGAGTSIAQGVGSAGRARKARGQFDRAEAAIPEQDPMQVAMLDTVRGQRKAFMAGTDPISAFTRQQSQNMVQQTQGNLGRIGRGTTSDMLRAQRVGENAMGAAGARAAQTGVGLLGMEGTMTNALADRAFNTQWSRANRMWSEYARAKEDSNAQIMAGIGMLPDLALGNVKNAPGTNGRRGRLRAGKPIEIDYTPSSGMLMDEPLYG